MRYSGLVYTAALLTAGVLASCSPGESEITLEEAWLREPPSGAPTAAVYLTIANTGTRPADLTLTTLGVPQTPPEPGGYGYAITRSYYDLDGAPVTLDAVAAGTRLVTVIEVRPFESGEARLMINDPLPAGLEIDNPNLLRAGDVDALDWLETADARHTEFRADRFLAAIDWRSDQPFRLAYIVRAVSPGNYRHPAATVEDMYRPAYRAHTATGRMRVVE